MLHDPILKFVFGFLPVAVNNEAALDEIEHDPSRGHSSYSASRTMSVKNITAADRSPTLPEIIMAEGGRDEVTVFLSLG